jgi:hypothetical protein
MKGSIRLAVTAVGLTLVLAVAVRADAGCGCDKPPPPVAPIRPAFASPNAAVTLIGEGIVADQAYVVHFQGGSGPEATVEGVAVVKRDFADGTPKPQLVVAAPALDPGPTAVTVTPEAGGAPVLEIPPSDFTMLQAPLYLDEVQGKTRAKCYRAGVAADGTVYFPLDIDAITERMIFVGRLGGYRLTFGPEDVVIYNTQGVLMQLLDPDQAGLYTIDDAPDVEDGGPGSEWEPDKRSFRMTYDRHEFKTYRERHLTDPDYFLDPNDPDWHVNGTRHIDHNHFVVAIHGLVDQAALPAAGETPPFTFRVTTTFADLIHGPKANTNIQWSAECGHEPPNEPPVSAAEVPSCSALPAVGCRRPMQPGRARLDVRNDAKDRRDAILWKWKKGQATAPGNFGDPSDADGVALCAYDESGAAPVLVLDAGVPANDGCGNDAKPCWRGKGSPKGLRGYAYRNAGGKPDGIERVALTPGADGRAQLVVQGRGKDLELPTLPLPLPLHVQLQSATGQCWETTFSADGVRKNTAERFRGKAH